MRLKIVHLCMSCWWEFHEDDIALELWGGEVMV
jgi:hypothetical protein